MFSYRRLFFHFLDTIHYLFFFILSRRCIKNVLISLDVLVVAILLKNDLIFNVARRIAFEFLSFSIPEYVRVLCLDLFEDSEYIFEYSSISFLEQTIQFIIRFPNLKQIFFFIFAQRKAKSLFSPKSLLKY